MPAGNRVLQAENIGAQNGGNGHQEGVAHGKFAVKAHKAAGCNGGAGAGNSRAGCDGLRQTHYQYILNAGGPLTLVALAHPVAGKQQASGYQQGTAHEIHVIRQALHQILDREHYKQRQGSHNNQ